MGSLVTSSNMQDSQRRLVANKPVEVALNEIVTRARVFTDAGGAAIALRDGDELITRASSGGIAPDVGARNKVEGSLTGQAVLKGVPIHIEDSDKDPRVDPEVCRSINTRSFIITPIAGSTTMLGVLAVFAPTANAFTRTDLAVLRTMADQIATALGGGAFMQQLWPSKSAESEAAAPSQAWESERAPEPEPVVEPPAPAPQRPVEQPRARQAAPEIKVQRPAPRPEPPAPVEEPEPLDIPELAQEIEVTPTPVRHSEVRQSKAPAIPEVEPKPIQEDIEPIAQRIEPPKVTAKATAAPARQPVVPPRPAAPKKEVAPQQSAHASGRMKPQKRAVETETRAVEEVEVERRHEKKTAATQTEEEVAARTDAVEWKGLSVEPERRSMGKIIVAVAAVVLVVGGIVGGLALRKPKTSTTASAPAAVPATTAPAAPVPAPALAPSSQKTSNTTPKPGQTNSSSNGSAAAAQPSTAPSKPTQQPIVIARGGGSNNGQVDEAPPQLAFQGAQPALPIDTGSGAMPARPTSNAVPAQVIRRVSPQYPDMARRVRQRGSVELQAQILKDGTVGKVDAISGPALLRGAAIAAVKQWRYRPAYLGGTPAESTVRVVINFDAAQ